MAKKQETSMITLYVVINYKDSKGNKSNVALLRKKDAERWNEDGEGEGIIEVQSEEIGWMKVAADGACRFQQGMECGHAEFSTLSHDIDPYLQEVYYR